METCWIHPDNSRWQQWLAQTPHDFYHLPRYAALCAEQEGGRPCAFLAAEGPYRLLLPLMIRPIDGAAAGGRHFDAASPYGYPSPLVWNQSQPDAGANAPCADRAADEGLEEFLQGALERLRAELVARDVVSLFVRFHPLLGVPLELFRRQGTLVHHGETVFLDLALSEQEQWHQLRPPYRNRISKAQRNGLVAEIDEAWECLDDFFLMYTDTMQRVRAHPFYFFPRQYFLELKDALEGALHLAVVRVQDDLACGGLFSEVDGIVQLHLTGSNLEFAEHHATKHMIDFVRRWAGARGNRFFHLGGGLGAQDDSLLYFKAGFSKLRSAYYTWRVVTDRAAYQELVRDWCRQASAEPAQLDGFFPAYRKPLPQRTEPLSTLSGP